MSSRGAGFVTLEHLRKRSQATSEDWGHVETVMERTFTALYSYMHVLFFTTQLIIVEFTSCVCTCMVKVVIAVDFLRS